MKKLFLYLLLISFLFGCADGASDTSAEISLDCSQDSDCVLVNEGCCGCSYGGNRTSVNINSEDVWGESLVEECGENYVCTAVISDDPSCSDSTTAACINSECAVSTD